MRAPLGPTKKPAFQLAAVLACVGLGLTACGTNNQPTNSETTQSSATNSTSETVNSATQEATSTVEAGTTPLGTANTEMKTSRPSTPVQLVPVSMRVGSHDGYDRVVIELAGSGTPGWFVDYTTNPSQQASGTVVDFDGDSALMVNIDGVVLPFEMGMEDPSLATITSDGPLVKQVQSLGTFEGRAQFVIGVAGTNPPYSVEVLENPTRIVIDVRNG